MIDVKILAKDKKEGGSGNGTNTYTPAYIPPELSVKSINVGDAYLRYDESNKALYVSDKNGSIMNFYAIGGIAALGQYSDKGKGEMNYDRLDAWQDYDASKAGYVLAAGLGYELNTRITALENGVIEGVATEDWVIKQGYLTTHQSLAGYATQNWVQQQGYLTSHQSLLDYATKAWTNNNFASKVHTHAIKVNGSAYTINASGSVDLGSYLPLVGGTMSNTNVVTNLNADLLDGVHLAGFGGHSGVMRSWGRSAYTSANQYFGNGNVVTIDPIGTGCLSANDTILSLGDFDNRNTQLLVSWDRDGLYYRRITDPVNYGSWKRLAFLTDNVASATKLQTARTLWGQSFDGTDNVSGAMSGVTNINSLLYLSTNVGIGTSNPTEKLEVNGNLKASNLLTSTSDGAYIKIGNVYLMYDAANNAIKVCGANNTAANFYALGGVSALGYGVDGGSGGSNYDRLDAWENYDSTKNGWVLSALLGNDLHTNVVSLTSRVSALEDGQIQGIATQDWVTSKGYLVSSDIVTKSDNDHTHAVKINSKEYTIPKSGESSVDLGTYLPYSKSYGVISVWTGTNNATTGPDSDFGGGFLFEGNTGTGFKIWNHDTSYYLWKTVAGGAWKKMYAGYADTAGTASALKTNAGSSTNPVYFSGGVPVATSYTFGNANGNAAVSNGTVCTNLNADLLDGLHSKDFSYAHQSDFAFNVAHHSNYVTFDKVNPDGAPVSEKWYSGFVSTHNNYLSSYIINIHRTQEWYVGFFDSRADTNPSWVSLVHSGNIGSQSVASATKLQTARTLWGQGFDGTDNVSGNLTFMTGSNGMYGIVPNQSGIWDLSIYTEGQPRLTIKDFGNVGIGTSNPTEKLEVNGNINTLGTVHATVGIYTEGYVSALGQNTSSDIRLKDIQGDVDLPIDMLANAPSKAFVWKGNKALGEQVGTIAQYWQKHLSQVVHDNNGYLAMQYDVAALLGVISVAKKVKSHEERIAELERENKELKQELKYERN